MLRFINEKTLKYLLLVLSLSLSAYGQDIAAPLIPFDAMLPLHMPSGLYLGECSGVAVNSKGHIFVLSCSNTSGPAYAASAAQLFEFDAKGQFIREIGHNLYAWSYAHMVEIDKSDNIWVTDKGSDMIIEFNPAGEVIMLVGRKQEASDDETGPLKHEMPRLPAIDGYFRQVTDIAWDKDGNSYISDGYINSRIAKLDKTGKWLKSWGSYGSKPGQFITPHSIAIDANGEIYVADRGNRRIQVFNGDGKFIRQFSIDVTVPKNALPAIGNKPAPIAKNVELVNQLHQPGSPWAICITPVAKQLKQFGWIHQIACPSENELYVAELLNWRVQKLTLHPTESEE